MLGAFPARTMAIQAATELAMNASIRPLAVVTGASSGIGLELARECAKNVRELDYCIGRELAAILSHAQSASDSAHGGFVVYIGAGFQPIAPRRCKEGCGVACFGAGTSQCPVRLHCERNER